MDNIKKKIGLNIRKYRIMQKLKQSELAELVGVEDKTISRIEVGGNYPSMDLLVRLSDVFHCELADLVNFKDSIDFSLSELSKDDLNVLKKFIKIIDEKLN